MQVTTGTFSFEPFYFVLDKLGTPIAGVQKGLFSEEDTQTILDVICNGLEAENLVFGTNEISVGLPLIYKDLPYYSTIGDSVINNKGLVYGVTIENLFNLNMTLKSLSERSSKKFFKGSVIYLDSFASNLKTAFNITKNLSVAYSFAFNYPRNIETDKLGIIEAFESHTAGYSTLHYSYKNKQWLHIQDYNAIRENKFTDLIFLQDLVYSLNTYTPGITYNRVPHNTKVPLGTYDKILNRLNKGFSNSTLFENISYFYKISGLSTFEVLGCGRLSIYKKEDYKDLTSKFINKSDVKKYLTEVALTEGDVSSIINKYQLK